jgi:trigger factor
MPTTQRTNISDSLAHLTITITRDDLQPQVNAELKRLRNKAQIKGFRTGQVPVAYLKKVFGKSILGDVFNNMLSEELAGYLKESGLQILGQPLPLDTEEKYSFKIDQLDPEYNVSYEVGFVPHFPLRGIDANEVFDYLAVSDLDELAEKDFDEMLSKANEEAPAEGLIQADDLVKIAIEELDGEAGEILEGGFSNTIMVGINDVTNEALKADLLAKQQGDTLRFNAYTMEDRDEVFVRKYILGVDDDRAVGPWFTGQISEVLRKVPAQLNEAFLTQNFGEDVTSKEAALEVLKDYIRQRYDQRADALLMRDFQIRLLEVNNFELPDEFLLRYMLAEEGRNNKQFTNDSIQQLVQAYPTLATDLRWSLIRGKIAQQYGLTVEEEDIRMYFRNQMMSYMGDYMQSLPPDFLDRMIDRNMDDKEAVERAERNIEVDKIFRLMRSRVTLQDVPTPSADIQARLDALSNRQVQEEIPEEVETTESETAESETVAETAETVGL